MWKNEEEVRRNGTLDVKQPPRVVSTRQGERDEEGVKQFSHMNDQIYKKMKGQIDRCKQYLMRTQVSFKCFDDSKKRMD